MAKIIAIDPGMSKCGLIIADLEQQKVLKDGNLFQIFQRKFSVQLIFVYHQVKSQKNIY